jgi:subtilisin family serine protease
MPFATGLAAAIAALGILASAPAALGTTARPVNAVRDQEWWLAGLHVTRAWRTSEGAGIIVAVLGTGVAADHPDLAGSVTTGPDYSGTASFGRVPGSPYWGVEGTAVAGVIAGHGSDGNWGNGIVGIAPLAKILSVRVTLEFNDPLASDRAVSQRLPGAVADGIIYAVDHGARVIDLPLDPGTLGMTSAGDPAAAGGSAAERAAVAYAVRKNVVLVAPAGDDGQGSQMVNYPAAYPGVIAVGATDRAGQLAPFSSTRSGALLTAPGVDLEAAAPPNAYNQVSSTSAASGIVAGMAALIVSRFPHLTVSQVTRALIESTVTTAGGTGLPPLPARPGTGTGYGTADAVRALQMAAFINAASQPKPPAARPVRAHKPAPRAAASPPPRATGALAGSVLRGAVAGVVLLIVLLGGALLVMGSRRRRARGTPAGPAGRAQAAQGSQGAHARGQHEHRRPDRAPAGAVRAARDDAAVASRRPPAAAYQPATDTLPSPGGWQGGGIGEIGYAPSAFSRPVMAPPPRAPTASRTSGSGSPPWDPAPKPEHMAGPLQASSAIGPLPEPGASIRVPGDMAAPPPGSGPAAGSPASSGFDLSATPADFDVTAPAFGLKPPAFGAAAPPGPDLPSADLPTRQSVDFAAAPVPADYAAPPSADPVTRDFPPPAPPPDPDFIWNLSATDVFPAAADAGAHAETPDVSPVPEEDPGTGES